MPAGFCDLSNAKLTAESGGKEDATVLFMPWCE